MQQHSAAPIETKNDQVIIASDDESSVEVHNIFDNKGNYSLEFCKKYLWLVKRQRKPKLDNKSSDLISQSYTNLRNTNNEDLSVAITPRFVDSIVRLATAHAKLRMSKTVTQVTYVFYMPAFV